ncbi:MAG: CopG family transcriptional regulator [Stigonema ocellatum SAG 48.90 = DSM 106950]|nr:CopG family transcriptional regulator [Stigonema ocellatum SAG 48.90 = DSM 106950]
MTDRRRSDDHKQISGYVPVELAREFKSICARLGVSQSDALEEILREWVTKRTPSHSSKPEQVPPRTIADLVRANMTKLKRYGVKNLPALARGEVLPTPGDFAIITSTLGMPEEERKMIWQQTFRQSLDKDYGGIKEHECECCENSEPTGVEL